MDNTIFISKYKPQIYAILRFVAGLLFLWHGSAKLFDFPPTGHDTPTYIVWIAGPVEFFGGLLIMIGFMTPWVAFACSGLMAYAYWSAHGTDAILPSMNGGELAMIYCFLFLYIASKGSGVFSIDHFLERRRKLKEDNLHPIQ